MGAPKPYSLTISQRFKDWIDCAITNKMQPKTYVADINPPRHFVPNIAGTRWYNALTDSLFVWNHYEVYTSPGNLMRDMQWQQQGLHLYLYGINELRNIRRIMGFDS
jgi:hypothetical protein